LVVAAASFFTVAALAFFMDLVASGKMGRNPKKGFA